MFKKELVDEFNKEFKNSKKLYARLILSWLTNENTQSAEVAVMADNL